MPWVRAELRGQKVFAKAKADGSLDVQGGRVEVRYQPADGRAYQAQPGNVKVAPGEVLPDEHCAAASPVAKPAPAARGAGASKNGAAKPLRAIPSHDSHGDGAVIAYADGACTGNPGPAGLGVVLLDGKKRVEISESLGHGTNNIAELVAIERALDASDPERQLVVYTDSKYSIGVLSLGWKAKANQELIARIKQRLTGRKVRFVLVPGHSGVLLNERADQLAREAVKSGTTRRESFG
jgi:ribonuclease HI